MVNEKHHSVFGMFIFPGFKLSSHAFFLERPESQKFQSGCRLFQNFVLVVLPAPLRRLHIFPEVFIDM